MRSYLKLYRNKKSISQGELADKIGISQNYYCYIENGERQQNISLELLQKLSKALEIPLDELIRQENQYKRDLKNKAG